MASGQHSLADVLAQLGHGTSLAAPAIQKACPTAAAPPSAVAKGKKRWSFSGAVSTGSAGSAGSASGSASWGSGGGAPNTAPVKETKTPKKKPGGGKVAKILDGVKAQFVAPTLSLAEVSASDIKTIADVHAENQ